MPYVSNMDDEQKTDPNAPQTGAVAPTGGGGGAVRLSPQSAVAPVGGSGTSSTMTGGNPPAPAGAGGQFASLNQYLSANQGQATPLAGKVATGVGQEYGNLQNQTNATIAGIGQQVSNAPGYTPSDPNVLAKEAANPVSFSGDQGNVKQFQSLLNNSYGGPASAESTSDYANQQYTINNAIAAGTAATTTEAGRENLLSQNEAAPTTGVTALNSAILSQDPNALASVEGAYKPFNNLLTGLQSGATDINAQIAKEQADAKASQKAAQDAITSQITGLNTNVTGELTSAQQGATQQQAQLKADLAAGTPTAADLQAIGMTSDQWNALSAADKAAATSQVVKSNQGQFGASSGTTTIDPTQFLTQTDPNSVINTANVATPEQYKQAQAFQTLLNGLNLGTPATIISPTTASQAGTAPTALNTYDYKTALSTANQAKADETAAAQAYVDALQAGADTQHAQEAAQTAAHHQDSIGAASSIVGIPLAALNEAGIGGTLGQGISNVTHAWGSFDNAAINTVKNIFCFHPDTQVEMANGSIKAICKIQVGDDTRGGKVLATTRGIGTGFYWYFGVLVTGKHAVKEDGVWVRVENSKNGREFKYLTEVVCNLTTDKHRIWANGIEFADERETDNYENLNLDDSLRELNAHE